jgi:branched-chain amino acid transport system permease protein
MIGGILYTFADHRLSDLSSSSTVSELPSVFRTPLQQPLFILGVLFILVVFFVPGGLTRIGQVGQRLDRILRKPAVHEEVS